MERLGRGGMGVVYKVEHLRLGKLVAMKLLAGELSRRPEVARRFEREASLAARLSHPSTVQVFDYGVSDGLTWLVMELVPGRDLSQVLRREGPLPAERAVRLAAQVCSSLAEAHALGIVHRDIKPGNVMVGQAPGGGEVAKVLDFGLAKLRQGPEGNNISGRDVLLGTPAYMAPEQIDGRQVDARTDVYALGAMLYRMLTGEPVFHGRFGLWETLARHLVEAPDPMRRRVPHLDIPARLDAVVLRALAKKPDQRFQSVLELREALREAVADAGDDDEPARPSVPMLLVPSGHATRDEVASYERRLRRQVSLSRALVAAVLLGTAAALAALGVLSVPVWAELASSSPAPTAAPADVVR
ncbi:MAG: serine/threonine protein kinase [Myxococcales bacterium]|nr:MAG: serine/threonine protein kinase [Myxococcales bacterium]